MGLSENAKNLRTILEEAEIPKETIKEQLKIFKKNEPIEPMLSCRHWNGNQVVVIDVETTGTEVGWHEIYQISMLALDANMNVRKDILPFDILMKPNDHERIDWSIPVMRHNKERILSSIRNGFDSEKAKDILEAWINKLKLPQTRMTGLYRCKIMPLGQNYGAFDKPFLESWLGCEQYNEWFSPHYRDTMVIALYLSDRAAFHAEKVPFSKYNLSWLAKTLGVELARANAHNSLFDCMATAEIYKRLLTKGLIGQVIG